MKRISLQVLRRFREPGPVKNILMSISILLIFDTLLAFLGGPYLSQNVGAFLIKSTPTILSDLLFLEGAIIFPVGAFATVAIPLSPPTKSTGDAKRLTKKRIHPGILLMITGASLLGLSIVVGIVFA